MSYPIYTPHIGGELAEEIDEKVKFLLDREAQSFEMGLLQKLVTAQSQYSQLIIANAPLAELKEALVRVTSLEIYFYAKRKRVDTMEEYQRNKLRLEEQRAKEVPKP